MSASTKPSQGEEASLGASVVVVASYLLIFLAMFVGQAPLPKAGRGGLATHLPRATRSDPRTHPGVGLIYRARSMAARMLPSCASVESPTATSVTAILSRAWHDRDPERNLGLGIDGRTIPQLGFGVYQVPPWGDGQVVRAALAAGYRHIDTGQVYGNERGRREAMRSSDLARDDVSVTSKLSNACAAPS